MAANEYLASHRFLKNVQIRNRSTKTFNYKHEGCSEFKFVFENQYHTRGR